MTFPIFLHSMRSLYEKCRYGFEYVVAAVLISLALVAACIMIDKVRMKLWKPVSDRLWEK